MLEQYAVIGNPVGHSKSPRIHAEFARQTRQELQYRALEAPIQGFNAVVDQFIAEGGRGFNITLPFKEHAFRRADRLSERAQRAAAINTIAVGKDGLLYGDNTDGAGLVRDLTRNHLVDLRGKRVLILGAGGAVRGVLAPLLAEQPYSVSIANRTEHKAMLLAEDFSDLGRVQAISLALLGKMKFDWIINGTSASLQGQLPALPTGLLVEGGGAYDMMYSAQPTPFMHWAKAQRASLVLDGLGMLVEQAAESFYLWRGVRPNTTPVMALIRQLLV